MRIFVVKAFGRFQRRERITDAMLCDAVQNAQEGLIEADLGGGLVKQRVARRSQGKRGGFRVFVAFRSSRRAVFLYGFAKSERDNVALNELAELKLYASRWLALDDESLERFIADDDLREVFCD